MSRRSPQPVGVGHAGAHLHQLGIQEGGLAHDLQGGGGQSKRRVGCEGGCLAGLAALGAYSLSASQTHALKCSLHYPMR